MLHRVEITIQQGKGIDVYADVNMEEVADKVGEEDSTVINGGAPTVKTLHYLIGRNLIQSIVISPTPFS